MSAQGGFAEVRGEKLYLGRPRNVPVIHYAVDQPFWSVTGPRHLGADPFPQAPASALSARKAAVPEPSSGYGDLRALN